MTSFSTPSAIKADDASADADRRFGGLRRLFGEAGYARIRAGRVAVVGVGGVGSWAAEALARCGVARLVLIDLDHVSESNVNRQIQALTPQLGQAKVLALKERIAHIHPACEVHAVEDFVDAANWPGLCPADVDVVIDACDDPRAKGTLARWALQHHRALVIAGAAGGKMHAHHVEVADLLHVTHDALLAQLRQRLRKEGLLPPAPRKPQATPAKGCGLRCVFSRDTSHKPVTSAEDACAVPAAVESNLHCHGYGSVVTVTATFGMVAADEALRLLRTRHPHPAPAAESGPQGKSG